MKFPTPRPRRLWLPIAGALLLISGIAVPPGVASADPRQQLQHTPGPGAARWVATWGASPQDMGNNNYTGTIRNIVFAAVGGHSVRVRLTNTFGNQPLKIGDAYIGVSGADGNIHGPNVPLTFAGSRTTTIPQGAEALSDPVSLTVPALTDLAVSVYVPQATERTGHSDSRETSYITQGTDHAGDTTTAAYAPTSSWLFVDSVDVMAGPPNQGTVVALGDSITDGAASTVNANKRWPNDLARRLNARKGVTLSVADEGISGNQVLQDTSSYGVSALNRFDRDVVDRTGAKDVILLEGINDIGAADAQANQLIAAYQQLIARAHAAHLKIFGGTLTPFKGDWEIATGYWSPEKEQTRETVNNWILHSGAFDGVIDFAKATADPSNPQLLNPAYDSNDHLHPNDAGYQAMADTINLPMLLRPVTG
ncbi:SGNH/GDSL hydrolase family protein [Actinoallomurus vinaceus]|uniref:SGNH/GDSL hydrolase family protein n=2 Tax=Actinoallomurus vinaceus TaxID=1080074 RepID=A0ABP8UI54_9ACTN